MTAPSVIHERRLETLDTAAVLAGCLLTVTIEVGQIPDVARADLGRRRLFIGDAKASETQGNFETLRRLRRYARAATAWADAGYTVRLGICHGPEAAADWRPTLHAIAVQAGLSVCRSGRLSLE